MSSSPYIGARAPISNPRIRTSFADSRGRSLGSISLLFGIGLQFVRLFARANEEIGRIRKSGGDASELISEMKSLSEKIKRRDEEVEQLDHQLRQFLENLP